MKGVPYGYSKVDSRPADLISNDLAFRSKQMAEAPLPKYILKRVFNLFIVRKVEQTVVIKPNVVDLQNAFKRKFDVDFLEAALQKFCDDKFKVTLEGFQLLSVQEYQEQIGKSSKKSKKDFSLLVS